MNDNAELVKKIRERSGLSRKDFCEIYGIPYQTMTDWELGHRNPPDYLVRFMAYYVEYQKTINNKENNKHNK